MMLRVVYSDGNAAVRHDPSTENASTKIIAIGRIRKTVDTSATANTTTFIPEFVTRWRLRPPPFDCERYALRPSHCRRRIRKTMEITASITDTTEENAISALASADMIWRVIT